MYGLVNIAVQRLVIENYGEHLWYEIAKKAGVLDIEFSKMKSYPDKITYDMVESATQVLDTTPEEILEGFGEYFTLYVAREGYGDLLKMGGNTVIEFCQNLNNLHSRIAMIFPELTPPHFSCVEISEKFSIVRYTSTRAGLAPMVVGLLKGLAKLLDEKIAVTHLKRESVDQDYDDFRITYDR